MNIVFCKISSYMLYAKQFSNLIISNKWNLTFLHNHQFVSPKLMLGLMHFIQPIKCT